MTTESMRAAKLKPEALFWKVVAETPKLASVLTGTKGEGTFHVAADYNYRARKFASPRMLLVGDAACFLDPMFSTGVFLALLSAKLAAREVLEAQRRGRELGFRARSRYTRKLRANIATLERLVLAFYDNRSFAVFMERSAPWRMIPAVNSLVAGHADPRWSVRWRYWLFLLVCRLQQVCTVVPPVKFAAAATAPRKPDSAEVAADAGLSLQGAGVD